MPSNPGPASGTPQPAEHAPRAPVPRPAVNWTHIIHDATRAPSSHNVQPWRFRLVNDGVELWLDRSRRLPVVDPAGRELIISCGAALAHLELAMASAGYRPVVHVLPDPALPDFLARVSPGVPEGPLAENARLCASLERRRTVRGPSEDTPLPGSLRTAIDDLAASAGAMLVPIDDARRRVADLVAEGDRIQWQQRRYRRELARWMRSNAPGHVDGMPGYAFGFGNFTSRVMPRLLGLVNLGRYQATHDARMVEAAPWLGVLSTPADTIADRLAAGRALALVLLRAAANGVFAAYFNQAIQVPELRTVLGEELGLAAYPQLLFRLGYGPPGPPTPRRPLRDVVDISVGTISRQV